MIPQSRPPVILLTRPLAQSQRFAVQILDRMGPQEVVISPAMEIRGLAVAAPEGAFSDLIFTSQNAASRARALGFALPDHAYCVGDATLEAARAAGFQATQLGGDADGLVAGLVSVAPKGRLLHLHGVETRGDVVGRLVAAGIAAVGLAIYDQPGLPLSAAARRVLDGERAVLLPLFSPRTARILADQGPFGAALQVVAISPVVGQAARALAPDRLEIAQSPDAAGMLAALGEILFHPRT